MRLTDICKIAKAAKQAPTPGQAARTRPSLPPVDIRRKYWQGILNKIPSPHREWLLDAAPYDIPKKWHTVGFSVQLDAEHPHRIAYLTRSTFIRIRLSPQRSITPRKGHSPHEITIHANISDNHTQVILSEPILRIPYRGAYNDNTAIFKILNAHLTHLQNAN